MFNLPVPTVRRVAFAALLTLPVPAAWADQREDVIEEIVVTATFRQDSLVLVPSSISVLSADSIAARHGQHLDQLLNMAPNVHFAAGASRGRFTQIRGIGERSQFKDPLDASVGLIIDNVDLSGMALAGTLHDAAQIEILRGPQGTNFGSNALGGLMLIRSNEPTRSFEGSVSTGLGNYGLREAGAVLSGPLSDNVRGRLAIHQFQGDGYVDNDFLGRDDTNDFDELTLRGKLAWQPNPELLVNLSVFHIDVDNGYDAFSLANTRRTGSDEPGHDRQKSTALALNANYQLASFDVETNLFVEQSDLEYGFDWDWSSLDVAFWQGGENNARDRSSFGLDVRAVSTANNRIAGADWVFGAYVYQRNVKLDYADHCEGCGIPPSSFSSKFESDRVAAYGQLEWPLSDRLTVSIGGRLERYQDNYRDSADVAAEPVDELWGGRLSLVYLVHPDVMVYGSVSRGYKTGGVNGQAVAAADPQTDPDIVDFLNQRLTFDEETLLNYEIGVKGEFLDGAVTAGMSAFYMTRKHMQAKAWVFFPPVEWRSYVDNVEGGHNRGVEAEATWQLGDDLVISAGLGILETDLGRLVVQDVDTGRALDQAGRDQAHAPGYQYFLAANYQVTQRVFVNLQFEGKDAYFFSNSHNIEANDYGLVHLTAGYRGEQLELSLWGRNLLDEDYQVRGFYFNQIGSNEPYYQLGEPMTFGVSARFRF